MVEGQAHETDRTIRGHTRSSDRVRTFLKAVIEFNNGATKVDCTVKNISPSGARLNVTEAVTIPTEFNLHIPHRGEVLRSQLVWREKDGLGLRFLNAVPARTTPSPERSPSAIEQENIRLRRRVIELSRRLEALGQDPNVDEAN